MAGYIGNRRQNNLVSLTGATGTIGSGVVFPALGNSAVGTVSESSGTPTGDIIERGSNPSGEYVKFADGTLICTVTQLNFDATSTSTVDFPFPANFSGDVVASMAGDTSATSRVEDTSKTVVRGVSGGVQEWKVRTFTVGNQSDNTISLIAIGRWY